MNKNNKIYVAGHKGLVGSALIRTLRSNGYSNILTASRHEVDLTNSLQVDMWFARNTPEYVFDCAAKVGGIHANDTYPAQFINENLLIQNNIINSCFHWSVKKLMFLGSVCFAPGTSVITSDGIKNIEDINIGDFVLTHTGKYNKVYKTTTNPYAKSIFNIDLYGWNNIQCTPEHLIFTDRGFIQANELTNNDYVIIPIPKSEENDIVSIIDDEYLNLRNAYVDIKSGMSVIDVLNKYNITNKSMVYGWKRGTIPHYGYIKNTTHDLKSKLSELCGYFVAEGWIGGKESGGRGSGHNVSFSTGKDKSFMDDVSSYIKDIFNIPIRNRCLKTSYTVECNNKLIYSFFKKFYNSESIHRAHTKRIPSFIMNSSGDSIKQFLKGYWRGDGHWSLRKDRENNEYICVAASTSKELIYQIQHLLLKVGIFSSVYFKKKSSTCVIEGRLVNQKDQWEIRIVGKDAINFIKNIVGEVIDDFIPVYKNREDTHIFDKSCLKIKIKNIREENYTGVVYDLSVENDNSYTANGLAVHNCIYPKYAEVPVKEESLLTGYLEPTNEPYAIAKIAGIKMCQAYRKQYGCDYISVMPCNLYGINDNFHPTNSHVLPALIRRFHEAKLNNLNEVVCWGDGSALREFMNADDLADALLFLMNNYSSNEIINIGYGKDFSIKEIVDLIKDIVEFKGNIRWDTSKPNGTPKRLLDSTKLFNMGWRPKIDLITGLKQTYSWYVNNKV